MSKQLRRVWLTLCLVAVPLTAACDYRLVLANAEHPVPVGAQATFLVRYEGGLADDVPLSLKAAKVSDPTLVELIDASGDSLSIRALKEGEVDIQLDVLIFGKERFTDTVTVRTARALRLELSACGSSSPLFLAGSEVRLDYALLGGRGEILSGSDYIPWQVRPAVAVEQQEGERYTLADWQGTLAFSSTVDDSVMVAQVVSPATIDGIEISSEVWPGDGGEQQRSWGLPTITSGSQLMVDIVPTVAGEGLCYGWLAHQAQSKTAAVCTVFASELPPLTSGYPGLHLSIDAVSPGTCTFELTIPQALGGRGINRELSFPVVED